ncbi:MAG: metallophosphoesterase family protein [Candidatus Omnitrophota bacterium]
MKIGVISDTHIPVNACELPPELIDALKGCNLIVHAGDLIDLCILDELKNITKVEAVSGNMDLPKAQAVLEKKKILNVAGKKLCLMHGYGSPDKLVDILKKEFFSQKPDIIVFGHSHVPMNEYMDGVLFFNPGSATDTTFAPYRSYGIIKIEKDEIKAEIHRLEKSRGSYG